MSAGRLFLLLLVATLGGCAGDGRYESRPAPVTPAEPAASLPQETVRQPPRPMPPSAGSVPPAAPPVHPGEREGRRLIDRLLPLQIADRNGWAVDILTAFGALRVPLLPENLCAAIAVIEQESGFQADPPVPGLARIVWQQIEVRRERYGIPKAVVDLALRQASPDGRSYQARIDALRTETQMNALYADLISELPGGKTLFAGFNPVRTGGPMQVSIDFAEEQVRQKPYPYGRRDSVRNEVFTRRGGVYFGIASLLDYPTSYSQMIYRFADFNAGRYSSRNAAFQEVVSSLSGQRLALDGDLLRYRDGQPLSEASDTQRAVFALRARLGLGEAEIVRDLKLEKSLAFEQTVLYKRLYVLADGAAGERRPRELLPAIALKSPKITRRLTTEWFARRVDGRYRGCLARSQAGA